MGSDVHVVRGEGEDAPSSTPPQDDPVTHSAFDVLTDPQFTAPVPWAFAVVAQNQTTSARWATAGRVRIVKHKSSTARSTNNSIIYINRVS
jgi:hypothetical protein